MTKSHISSKSRDMFYQRLNQYKDAELRMIYEYYKDDLIYIVQSDPDRILSELEQWTTLRIEHYLVIKESLGDAVFAMMFVQDILKAGRKDVIGFWKYLYYLKSDFHYPNLLSVLEEITQTGLVTTILLDEYGQNLDPELKNIQDQHKKHLLEKTQCLVEHRPPGSTLEEQSFYISERYVNMIVVSSDNFRQRSQHELIETGRKHEDVMEKELLMLEHIALNKLFRWSCQKQCDPRVVMVSGIPGVGKTTMMQKFIYDWVTGKLYQRFAFVFFFKFRDLNRLDKISLETMILQEYPHLQSQLRNILQDPEKLLFIFDGLDESNHQIDFTSTYTCQNTKQTGNIGVILVSLLRQSLLRGCSVLLTSRPAKLSSINTGMFNRVSEIMGFSPREIQMYFDRFFQNKELSEKAFHHVKENDTLYTFCYIPSYCWIICTVLSMCFKTQPANIDHLISSFPKTLSQLLVTFVSNIISNHSQDNSHAKELMTSIGWMAEHGVMNHIIVFDKRDLGSFKVNHSSHLTSSFIIESNQPPNVTFSFLHLIVQEFLAALVHYIDYSPEKLHRSLNKIKSYTDGRGGMFLRSLSGFLDSSTRSPLKCLGNVSHEALIYITNWLKEMLDAVQKEGEVDIKCNWNIFLYLYESQNTFLVEEYVGANRHFTLRDIPFAPMDCAMVAFILKSCRDTQALDVYRCNIQSEGWERLAPVLHTIKTINITTSKLNESCINFIAHALCLQECRIQQLCLSNNFLTERSCSILAHGIKCNQSLKKLDLSLNNLKTTHFCDLADALSSPTCRIEELLLCDNKLADSFCTQLASVISSNKSLRKLNLRGNNLEGRHFCDLATALSRPTCQIVELLMENTQLSEGLCYQLALAVGNNKFLKKLDLSYNILAGPRFSILSKALCNSNCRIGELLLKYLHLTESYCPQLASIVSSNKYLRILDLTGNNLAGPHFSDLVTALSSPSCSVQKLHLRNTRLTDAEASSLISMSSNKNLTYLDLINNDLQDGSSSFLTELQKRSSILEIRLINPVKQEDVT